MASDQTVPSDPRVVIPLNTGPPPLTTHASLASKSRVEQYMPCRQLCMHYTSRFFEQVHSMHFFYSVEGFYAQLDQTLENRGKTATSSWLCSLYSIFAIGSIRPNTTIPQPRNSFPDDGKNAFEYLALAKELVPSAIEEADIETVKAFALLVSIQIGTLTSHLAHAL